MKKILFCLACICIMFCSLEVNAACGAGVNADGEFICLVTGATQANSKGTLYPENGTILVMKNYNGGKIEYSSGIGNPIGGLKIKLVGDNYIKAENDFGLKVPLTGVEFIGDGTLTIISKLPIATFDSTHSDGQISLSNNVTTIKIVAGEQKNENTENVEAPKQTEDTDVQEENDSNNNLMLILVCVSCLVSVISLISVVIVVLANKKK